ncbi:MAG: hypothetical protein FWB86_12375 [Treponema sp.]|nr:hypothetical protein [Treponema sp.]MCL2252129.1 hypothetical protein [Treponema sp.]
MTLSERNVFFKIGIFFCAAVILLLLAASFMVVPSYSEIEENARRPNYVFQVITGRIMGNNYYAVHTALILAALYSFAGMLLIHSFFERTPTPEILYIAFFTISFSLEALRLFLPLQLLLNFPSFYLRISARVLLFARFFGLFSLFTAGLCASGLDVQNTRISILIITIATLLITLGVPIDAHLWDTGFNLINGYTSIYRWTEILVFITTMISFLVASKVRGSKEYIFVAIGVMLALIGRNILQGTDNWLGAIQGIAFLSFGTWFLCSKVHKIHLWL